MIPKRPFLLRAFYDWIVENNMTPHMLVNSEAEDVNVPKQHIKDGKIVLNISPMAVQDFMMDNEALSFSARFGGVSFYIYCPMYSIEAIYARESPVDGISFSADEYADSAPATENAESVAKPAAVTKLSAVGSDKDAKPQSPAEQHAADDNAQAAQDEQHDRDAEDGETPPTRKRPALRVVK